MKRKIIRAAMLLCMLCMYCVNTAVVAATTATNYGKNAGEWATEQLFWVGIIAVVIVLVGCLLKRSYVGSIITVVAGGIILYFIRNPEKISDIGESLWKIVSGG
ncbi:TcpD family membrane protein [Anaeromicropila populeti]|uniref:TrbC/VIRB2 family protein n=1 Tax=Anaeromicropila populeti TaxID=37658 RepID=A0A1I6LX87_9FIRM|nr:TcpD family membrane protein [Anaeromicropila populeti]SFS08043.1 hypothetical protein SAMN05661086_03641 [Anaeromicropila populeti]